MTLPRVCVWMGGLDVWVGTCVVGREYVQDLAPEPQKGKAMPEGMINALLRIGPADTVCPLEVPQQGVCVCGWLGVGGYGWVVGRVGGVCVRTCSVGAV
jgi:hypothetical protein